MINIVRALMDKVDSMQEQMGNVSRDMEILKNELRRNARDNKRCNRKEECLSWAY